jgi:hypothetical protein
MQQTNTLQTVQVTADTGTILNVFAATFTKPETVVSELLQNARRAGATEVTIQVDGDRLSITDDGCGIEDFSILLAMAKSGWSEDVKTHEGPYGIGFISALFAAREVRITSRGRQLHEHTSTLRQLRPVDVVQVPFEPITRIELIGVRESLKDLPDRIHRIVRGFPLPVSVNGVYPNRPDALDERFVGTPIGQLLNPTLSTDSPRCYLMGLEIEVPGGRGYTPCTLPVLHLDPALVRGRMPDRAQVLEPEAVAAMVREALREHANGVLAEAQKRLSHTEWADKHLAAAIKWGLSDLVKACDALPGCYIAHWDSSPRMSRWSGDHATQSRREPISRSDVQRILDITGIEYHEDDRGIRVECLAYASGLPILNKHDLPFGHWIEACKVDIGDDLEITVTTGDLVGESTFREAYLGTVTLRVVEWIDMAHPAIGTFRLPEDFGTVDEEGRLLVTPRTSPSVVGLLNDFNEDERFDQEGENAAEEAFRLALAEACGQEPKDLLQMVLNSAMPDVLPARLVGQEFKLVFGSRKDTRDRDVVTWSIEAI